MSTISGGAGLEKAFQRHSRPQLPTLQGSRSEARKSRLLHVQSKPSWIASVNNSHDRSEKPRPAPKPSAQVHAQWLDYVQLGTLTEGEQGLIICCNREDSTTLYMFKKCSSYRQNTLSLSHPNVLNPKLVISTDADIHIGHNYARYTLEELLNVHVTFEEVHVQVVAKSIFEALKYLYEQGLSHGNISSYTIRICGRSGRAQLAAIDQCSDISTAETATRDLEDLGLTLLRSMESSSKRKSLEASRVRKELANNKVFGLSNPERWSGSKHLVDFVDDLFCARRLSLSKFSKPHEYMATTIKSPQVLLPLVELAALECFPLWQARN